MDYDNTHKGALFRAHAPAWCLDLHREDTAVVDGNEVGHAGDDAEALQDRGLDRLAITAVCWMKRKDVRHSASAQVLDNGALNCVFRPTAVAGAALRHRLRLRKAVAANDVDGEIGRSD